MSDILKKVCDTKKNHVTQLKKETPLRELEQKLKMVRPTRDFYHALKQKAEQKQFALIAEIKKASPSHGLIRPDFNPRSHAKSYQAAGATCLSILTDTPYFQGKNDYLTQARSACELPVLRKDFMIDPYQVYESRSIGADCILIIMAALSNEQAQELETTAFELNMDVLIEVHDQPELERATTHLQSKLVGVNNRNLKTLEIDIDTAIELKQHLPHDYTAISESGLKTNADLQKMAKNDIYCYLVGESLMRQKDLTKATQELLGLS